MPTNKTVFISADHGLAIVYFLQTDVLPALQESGARVVLLTDDGIQDQIGKRFAGSGLIVEGLRFAECKRYFESHAHSLQHWTHFLRWMGGSDRVNTNAMDGHLRQMGYEASANGKRLMPLIRGLTKVLRKSRSARGMLMNYQKRFTPNIYAGLFEKYKPSLVIASTPGWRWDRYLLREAAAVTVLSVTEQAGRPIDTPADELVTYLAWNGVTATTTVVQAGSSHAGEELLRQTAQCGADLLVMGAYTHSRLRQLILGGVTRHVISHAPLYVLMCH